MPLNRERRRVCFVTGTRAEFGLMESTLRALRDHPAIELQIVATGMHLHASRGNTLREIRQRWTIDSTAPWKDDTTPAGIAAATGNAMAKLAAIYKRLRTEIVVVVGDRVEAFAAASAAHVSGLIVAHVHGGDRALGQVDDALRHAITKLAHVHFPATRASGERLFTLGEDRWRIHTVGAPGIDGIRTDAAPRRRQDEFALLLLHPTTPDDVTEAQNTRRLIAACRANFDNVVALLPNSDPGSVGIGKALQLSAARGEIELIVHAPRPLFLGLLRDCRALIGNSSSGIIEAASFDTPALDIGPRQAGREHGSNVTHVGWGARTLRETIRRMSDESRQRVTDNPYDQGGAGRRIANRLAGLAITDRLRRKLIRY